ncbi:MAG: oxygen-independent coproporphyrinogen III oxidase [Archangium sp.]|nr:oxygen-independent coproporphyrinogen III oxidase [Archangium sp.]MDP3158252.1 oxygen-independent coproporphyrinogen III oxidase [Archangium sp.]MDP3569862.1 oxygen-independent coproporphyrinogen III oxidase [Archangium sp.]
MKSRELIAKYDVPGPRYTSYPTVPYWQVAPTQAQWFTHVGDAITRSRALGQGGALYVHVPFCRSLCHYCGCNTVITRDTSGAGPYVEALLAEWQLYVSRFGRVRLDEVHIGGGTPTYLTPEQLERLVGGLLSFAALPADAELGIEADPRVTTRAQLEVLAKHGFKRLSLGIQDFDEKVQHGVNRYQTVEEVRVVTEHARSLGFTSINYDLIYGLPRQTEQSIERTVTEVRALSPDRIAFYGYAHVPWMKTVQRRFEDEDVPGGEAKRVLYERGRELLLGAKYKEIGLDHFALESDGLWKAYAQGRMHRNFMGYTDRSTMPLFALGTSAIGDTWTAFAQNEKSLPAWHARIAKGELPIVKGHLLDEEDLLLRRHILDVMTRFETSWAPSAQPYFANLGELARDGLIELTASSLKVTRAGEPFVRNVCMALDARLARQAPDRPLFSRTV